MMQSDTEPKFCKDCKHYRPPAAFFSLYLKAACYHPSNMSKPELVHGRSYPMADNADLRKPEGNCGPDGAMFEAKPPEPPPKWEPCAYVEVPPPRKPRLSDLFRF